jgi:hypothetical protein
VTAHHLPDRIVERTVAAMTNPDTPEPDVEEPADALPEYEEVQMVEEGPPDLVPRRFWICSECSSLIAGSDATLTQQRHNAWHAGRMKHDM